MRFNLALVVAALFVGAACGLAADRIARPAREAPTAPEPAPAPPEQTEALENTTVEAPVPSLNRADLVRLATRAAAAYAAQKPLDPTEHLAGREFELRLPFDCGPPPAGTVEAAGSKAAAPDRPKEADASADGEPPPPVQSLTSVDDPRGKTIRLTARPIDWTKWPLFKRLEPPNTDAAEGFWIRWPWLDSASCPTAHSTDEIVSAATRETVGLVQLHMAGQSRLLQRGGRPYQVVRKLDEDGRPFRLVLSGRVGEFAENDPVRCVSLSPDERPICLIAVEIDHVAFEDGSAKQIAQWPD